MLDNTTKIKDIIASLQETEGINQKAELKSILLDKGITVEDTADMASIVSKVNNLKNADLTNLIPENIKKDVNINGIIGTLDIESLGGKKWASGTVNSISGSVSLNFKPSVIIMQMAYTNVYTYYIGSCYSTLIPTTTHVMAQDLTDHSSFDDNCIKNVTANGFDYNYANNNKVYGGTWIAIE